jgi:hypothetical protein
VRRQALEKWLNAPFFDDAVPGMLLRCGFGERDDNGRTAPNYIIAQVRVIHFVQLVAAIADSNISACVWRTGCCAKRDDTGRWRMTTSSPLPKHACRSPCSA